MTTCRPAAHRHVIKFIFGSATGDIEGKCTVTPFKGVPPEASAQHPIVDLVDDAVVPGTHALFTTPSGELLRTGRAESLGEQLDDCLDQAYIHPSNLLRN